MPKTVPKILIVEDEPFIRMDLACSLADIGFDVLEAPEAATALQMLDGAPDLHGLVTDIDMPGEMNGLALAREVRGRLETCRIIIMSGRSIPDAAEMPEGSVFLEKPFRATDLASALE